MDLSPDWGPVAEDLWLGNEQLDFMDDFGSSWPVLAKGCELWGHKWEARSEEPLAAVGATSPPAPLAFAGLWLVPLGNIQVLACNQYLPRGLRPAA